MTAAFAELLATSRNGGARLLTPEDPAHSWCAVGLPLVLSARVSAAAGSSRGVAATREGLLPLLPFIFEKLLGRPLDVAPWDVAVIKASREEEEDGSLSVKVALHTPPPATEGLFEVGTPLGLVTLRLEGVEDSALEGEKAEATAEAEATEEESDPVLLLALPSDWLEPCLRRAAWDAKAIELGGASDDEGAAWRAWLAQWGEVSRLQLSCHAGEAEAENSVVLAASFADPAACGRCAAALGRRRLLVLKDPERAAFACVQHTTLRDFESKVEQTWSEHLQFAQEISRIDRGLVLEEATDALPAGIETCFSPLMELLERWLQCGTLHATSTICAQRRLQEADAASRSKATELFRRACWHGAFRVVLQIRPCQDDAETLALALCEHWRKSHGVCLDLDTEELGELAGALQEVWLLSGRAEDALRRSAEEEALSAEKALIEELEAEEGQRARERKKREKKHQKARQRKKEKVAVGGSKEDAEEAAEAEEAEEAAASPKATEDAAGNLDSSSEDATATTECAEDIAVYRRCSGSSSGGGSNTAAPVSSRRSGERRGSASSSASAAERPLSPPLRRPADIEKILEAVRKSEELHRSHLAAAAPAASAAAAATVAAAAAAAKAEPAARAGLRQCCGQRPEGANAAAAAGACAAADSVDDEQEKSKGSKASVSTEVTSTPEASTPRASVDDSDGRASSHGGLSPRLAATSEPEEVVPPAAAAPGREVVTWGDLCEPSVQNQQLPPSVRRKSWADISADACPVGNGACAVPVLLSTAPPLAVPVPPVAPAPTMPAPTLPQLPAEALLQGPPQSYAGVASATAASQEAWSPAASSPSKSSRRSARRRRQKADAETKVGGSDSSTTAGGTGGEPSEAEELPRATTVPAHLPPALGPVAESSRRRFSESSVTTPVSRNIVTLSDLGFDLGTPGGTPAGPVTPLNASTAPSPLQQQQQFQQQMQQQHTPLAMCGAPATWPCQAADGWAYPSVPLGMNLAPPSAWVEQSMGDPMGSPIMRTYPMAGPNNWDPTAACDASRRSPAGSPVGSPAQADHGDALRSWLTASGLPSSGADLAAQLRAVAPEAYED
mmetsp:Transcript_75967/g.162992  ORF Transcript_75967/g.162992 Transcript_75967/m.162992 type:complete len:1078 (-) Transcript_75967:163-3396(-)